MFELQKVSKAYNHHKVLSGVDFLARKGDFITITGPSGSGKTTLINLLIGAEQPTSGSIEINGQKIEKMTPAEMQFYRRKIGIIFQDYRLLKHKTVFENIAFALEVCSAPPTEIKNKVSRLLEIVDLSSKINNFPKELSGGEQQRVAIARALVHNPEILLADEPTGNLDYHNSRSIAELLKQINQEFGTTIILTTHDPQLIQWIGRRVIEIRDGQIWEKGTGNIEFTQTFIEESSSTQNFQQEIREVLLQTVVQKPIEPKY